MRQRVSGKRTPIFCLVLIAFFLTSSAAQVASSSIQAWSPVSQSEVHHNSVSREYWPTESWQNCTPEQQGMDSRLLDSMIEYINNNPTDSVIIVRHGYIVYETYLNGMRYTMKHHLQSATKSITSILIGIAIDKGFIKNVSQRVVDFFPDRTIANLDSRKQNMTLRHLLMMTTGFAWDEWTLPYEDRRNSLYQMHHSPDPVQNVLDTPMAYEPGEKWVYCSGASLLLGAIIQQVSNHSVATFAREFLFDPIGVGTVKWDMTGGYYHTAGGLYMTPRDMTRIGYLMLNNGTWNGKEIVSANWVAESTNTTLRPASTNPSVDYSLGYGYQWWSYPTTRIYFASGYGGQHIYVVPQLDIVVIFTANPDIDGPDPSYQALARFIYPSVLSDGPLPERPKPKVEQPSPDMTGVLYLSLVVAAVLIDASLAIIYTKRRRNTKTARLSNERGQMSQERSPSPSANTYAS